MSRRPDSTDRAIAADRTRAKHHRCVCGDTSPCQCTPVHAPSQGWRRPDWWLATWDDLRLIYAHIAASKAEAPVTTRAHDHNRGEFSPDCPGCCHGGALTGAEAMRLYRALAEQSAATQTSLRALSRKIDKIGTLMSVSVDQLDADIQTLIAGYQAVVAQNVQLQAALASADADKAAAVQAAIVAEDADGQQKIDAADALVAAANAPAAPPADGGDGSAPVDGGDAPTS